MVRLIVLLVVLAALVILAVQNLSTSIALVILSGQTAELSFGLLLVGAVCLGALITLLIYGLMSLRRSPESKYRPIGRPMPYPDSSGSTTLPASGPASGSSSTYRPVGPTTSSGSSAFVSDPPSPQRRPEDSPRDTFSSASPSSPPPQSASGPFPQPQSTIDEAPKKKRVSAKAIDDLNR